MNIAILFSGRGTNLKSILDYSKNDINMNVVCSITNNKNAFGIQYSIENDIPVIICLNEQKILEILNLFEIEFVVLAGYMKILSSYFCLEWEGRCINIHPSLLPNYKGLNTHERVLKSNNKKHGCSIHYVTSELDSGQIIAQEVINIEDNDTIYSLSSRVLEIENKLYPLVIKNICNGKIYFNTFDGKIYFNNKQLNSYLSLEDLTYE